MNLPDKVRGTIKRALWEKLDELDWLAMSDADHSAHYERWTKSPEIGGKLSHFMDPRAVRVYIKDTLVKDYARQRLLDSADRVLERLGVSPDRASGGSFIKPHGVILDDGTVVCWGNSRDWKHLLIASFERQRAIGPVGSGLVVMFEGGRTADTQTRELINDAASRLGVASLHWWD